MTQKVKPINLQENLQILIGVLQEEMYQYQQGQDMFLMAGMDIVRQVILLIIVMDLNLILNQK